MTSQPNRPLRILMISALEVWALAGGGGAPSLLKTLEGYGRRGHHVDYVTCRVGANHHHGAPVLEPPPIEGVSFHTFDLPSLGESRLPAPEIARKADQKLRFALLFPYLASRRAQKLLRQHDYDLLYGYEVHGVLAQGLVRTWLSKHPEVLRRSTLNGPRVEDSDLRVETRSYGGNDHQSEAEDFNPQETTNSTDMSHAASPGDRESPPPAGTTRSRLPIVSRFQGTVMRPYLDRKRSLARKAEEVLALKMPADLYIMTNDGTQGDEVLERLNPRSAGKVRFWRNGLDLNQVRPPSVEEAAEARAALGLSADDFVLVTSSRLARWKRIDRAVDAVEVLRRQHGVSARLLIVGDGEERANLEAQAAEQKVGDLVSFVGAVPQSEVTRYLWASDVVLSVNELSNVGNPLLEAMLAGRCIVTLDEGDTGELIKNGETGVLLPRLGAPVDIARALLELHGDPERRRALADGALTFARANFWSWRQRIDAEVDAIEELCGLSSQAVAHAAP